MSKEDLEAIQLGYALKEAKSYKLFEDDFNKTIEDLDNENLIQMVNLISNGQMNVIVVDVKKSKGMYHDKIGILEDVEKIKSYLLVHLMNH